MSLPPRRAVVTALRAAGCVFAEEEAQLLLAAAGPAAPAHLAALLHRRISGEPLEHVLGWAEFRGVRYAVDRGVFVPRRRTAFLVERAAALAPPAGPAAPVVVDLCCGTGALGAALTAELGGAELHCVDIDPAAVGCARRNVRPVGGTAHEGDLYGPLPARLRGRVQLLLANVPYVPTGEIALLPAEARLHEARIALDGGPDGFDVLRRVAAGAGEWLRPGGSLLFETSERQSAGAVRITERAGLLPGVARSGELHATVVTGTRRV
ncbi:putative protein N(5)-glutamine methyltransferase [Streptomyces yaizuensis]|uniref:Methyltransferase small domain-containing protein n=1 Tax=Streptomyces yaizuensis TaxID=2989713 RepID=A0ABQ5NTY3_9ACTN|nr:putative protein N(5)-glutamine methyltransferase [Streptomyces sp. YSPA8]GLF93814.1 putative protein N(5)-glutamine methyltransferase [Streptomyces sp. YSPA8]